MRKLGSGVVVGLLCVVLVGCFEEPVREHIHAHFTPDGRVVITLVQQLASPDAASDNPAQDLDMTPQQVMNLMRLELKEAALGCRMVWDCVTCYKCQEHCPRAYRWPMSSMNCAMRRAAAYIHRSWGKEDTFSK